MDSVTTAAPISPLRQRMQHDMMMRGLGPHTQKDYIRHVRRLAAFLERPPDTASEEDLRRFQIHQPEIGRASCREGVCQYVSISVVAVSLKKKTKVRAITLTTTNKTN